MKYDKFRFVIAYLVKTTEKLLQFIVNYYKGVVFRRHVMESLASEYFDKELIAVLLYEKVRCRFVHWVFVMNLCFYAQFGINILTFPANLAESRR